MRLTASLARSRSRPDQHASSGFGGGGLTLSFLSNAINTGTRNQYIIDDGEDTFATDPRPIFVFDTTVIQH